MMKFFICTILFATSSLQVFCQSSFLAGMTIYLADSSYSAKNYDLAKFYYLQLATKGDYEARRAISFYHAARCLALQNKVDSAFVCLKSAVDLGFTQKELLKSESDFAMLHSYPPWQEVVESIQFERSLSKDPDQAQFITEDVHRFWKSYDMVLKDTTNFQQILKNGYFDKASRGMNDYMSMKVSSIRRMELHLKKTPKLYASIRENTLKADAYKEDFRRSFRELKKIYPEAVFPDVYFIIGAFSSGGTVSDAGLLIGVNQCAKDETTDLSELSFGDQLLIKNVEGMPYLIAHELIHFQQSNMKKDTINLFYALEEGMADFIGELISAQTANPELFKWAAGREKAIWDKFKKEMHLNRYGDWIGNYQQATPDNFPDQAYWIGYQICKAYYENAKDKKQAIYDILNLQDSKNFLEQSGWEEKLNNMK